MKLSLIILNILLSLRMCCKLGNEEFTSSLDSNLFKIECIFDSNTSQILTFADLHCNTFNDSIELTIKNKDYSKIESIFSSKSNKFISVLLTIQLY